MDKQDYNFEDFVFPKFQQDGYDATNRKSTFDYDFWYKGQVMNFDGDSSFVRAKFLDTALLRGIQFKKVKFIKTIFESNSSFNNCIFLDEAKFGHAIFKKTANFSEANFNLLSMANAEFEQWAYFYKVRFGSVIRFYRTKFREKATFDYSTFNGICEFDNNSEINELRFFSVIINGRVIFKESNISKLTLESINKGNDKPLGPPNLEFERSLLTKNCIISNIDMSNTSFDQCDISEVDFRRCVWPKNKNNNRILLNENGKGYRDLEEQYRGLKKNFDSKKDWELSGLAYVSEMDIRRRRLFKEKHYFNCFIYWFYGFFGRYTQDFKRPLVSLFILIGVFSGMYYFMDFDVLKAFQRGIKGALPYLAIDTENPFKGYWLIARNIEFLLGGTFLTFFILALRKRFKQ